MKLTTTSAYSSNSFIIYDQDKKEFTIIRFVDAMVINVHKFNSSNFASSVLLNLSSFEKQYAKLRNY